MYCKVCGEHLYKDLDIRVLFKTKYEVHKVCEKYMHLESSLEVIPITNNVIYFEYLLPYKININEDYIFTHNILRVLEKYQATYLWSAIFIYDEEEYESLNDETKYLLLHLGQNPIVFISLYPY